MLTHIHYSLLNCTQANLGSDTYLESSGFQGCLADECRQVSQTSCRAKYSKSHWSFFQASKDMYLDLPLLWISAHTHLCKLIKHE